MKEKMTKRVIFSKCSYLDVNHFLMETFTGGVNKAERHYSAAVVGFSFVQQYFKLTEVM